MTYLQTSATIHEVGSTEPGSGAGYFALFPREGRTSSLRVQFGRGLRYFELTQIPQQEPRSIHEDSQEEEPVMRRGAVQSNTISQFSLHADNVVTSFEYHHGLKNHIEHEQPIHRLKSESQEMKEINPSTGTPGV